MFYNPGYKNEKSERRCRFSSLQKQARDDMRKKPGEETDPKGNPSSSGWQ